MDNDLVEFAMNCPTSLKVDSVNNITNVDENDLTSENSKPFIKTKAGKKILRSVMSIYIPKSIINLEKRGFSAPDASWFRGESIDFVRNVTSNKKPYLDFLDYSSVQKLVGEHTTLKP